MRWPKTYWRDGQDGLPSWVGLSLTGLYLGLVVTLGMVSLRFQRSEQRFAEEEYARRWVGMLGRCVSLALSENGTASAAAELRRAARESGVLACAIVDRAGQIAIASDPEQSGRMIPDEAASGLLAVSDVEAAMVAAHSKPQENLYAIRIREVPHAGTPTSRPSAAPGDAAREAVVPVPAWLVVRTVGIPNRWAAAAWWSCVGYVTLAGMGVFWVVYRIAARALRPMATIRQRLLSCQGQVAEQLALLRVNDTMDNAAAAWNRFVEFIREMRDELQALQLRAAVETTLDTYRSERLTAVLSQMPHGVLVLEDGGRISFANRSACRMLGVSDESLAGKEVREVLPEPIRAGILAGGRSGSRWVDHAIDGADGATTVRFTMVPLDRDGDAADGIVFMQDVSQFKEMERARDAFLYHVTHELRTPLTNIRAYAETLAGGLIDDEQSLRDCYNVISGETERLQRLIENILNVSQLEVGTARLNFGEVYVDRMVRDVVRDQQASADAKNIDLRLRLPPKLPAIRGDKERLAAALANLLGNAIKYTPAGGQVEVTCTVDEEAGGAGTVKIAVSDTGIGIDPKHHERIFEKFYRVDDQRVESQPGTGLGLAIVRETVRLHGGTVTVESAPGRGSTFQMTLPVNAS